MARRANRWGRGLRWGGWGLLVALVFGWALRSRPVHVEMGTVGRGLVVEQLEDEGHTHVRRRWRVAAPVAGFLLEPPLRAGDAVREGEVVARLVSLPSPLVGQEGQAGLRARVAAAESASSRAEAAVLQAEASEEALEIERRRMATLVDAGSAAEAELEALEGRGHVAVHEVEMARAALAAAHHEQSAARAALKQGEGDSTPGRPLELASPLDGVVLAVNVEEAGPVAPGALLVEVGAKAPLEVRVPMLSDVVPGLAPGMEAEVRDWGGPPLPARVLRIEPPAVKTTSALGVEEARVTVVLGLREPPPAALGDGFRVRARVMPWRGEVLRVPAGALVRRGDGWGAWTVRGGRARWAEVRRGHAGPDGAEVLSGLSEGDEVVLFPDERMAEGVRVASPGR